MISLGDLTKAMQMCAVSNAAPKKKRKRNRRKAAPAVPGAMALAPVAGASTQRRPRRRRARPGRQLGTLEAGMATITRSELLVEDTSSAGGVLLNPLKFSWLKSLAAVFETFRFERVSIEYRPLVGTTNDGAAAFGVDWATTSYSVYQRRWGAAPKRAQILACSPNWDGPVWERSGLIHLAPTLLHQRMHYSIDGTDVLDTAPGTVVYMSAKKGEIWIHYTVRLSGTR